MSAVKMPVMVAKMSLVMSMEKRSRYLDLMAPLNHSNRVPAGLTRYRWCRPNPTNWANGSIHRRPEKHAQSDCACQKEESSACGRAGNFAAVAVAVVVVSAAMAMPSNRPTMSSGQNPHQILAAEEIGSAFAAAAVAVVAERQNRRLIHSKYRRSGDQTKLLMKALAQQRNC